MNGDCIAVEIRGETLWLHPERALLWPARRTVIVADTHFGKSSECRRHGMAVPDGADAHDRERLTRLIVATDATRLLILGDFLHAPIEAGSRDAHELTAWCESLRALRALEVRVIAGNHDRGVTRLWRPPLDWHEGDLIEGGLRFTHDAGPGAESCRGLYTVSGHLHPVCRLMGLRKRAARVPVFWQRAHGLILPSFGLFTGGFVVTPGSGDRLYAVGSTRVVAFPVVDG